MPPTIHPVHEPTMGIRPGVEVTFDDVELVRGKDTGERAT
jgi:hypothetical protein